VLVGGGVGNTTTKEAREKTKEIDSVCKAENDEQERKQT